MVSLDQEESVVNPLCYSGKMVVLIVMLHSNKKNKLLIYPTIWMILKVIMLRKRSQTEKSTYSKFCQ